MKNNFIAVSFYILSLICTLEVAEIMSKIFPRVRVCHFSGTVGFKAGPSSVLSLAFQSVCNYFKTMTTGGLTDALASR
jgi:hypothetical protein